MNTVILIIAIPCILSVCLVGAIRMISHPDPVIEPAEPVVYKISELDKQLEVIQFPSGVFEATEGDHLAAAQGKIFFQATVSTAEVRKSAIVAVDAISGNILWQIEAPGQDTVDTLYPSSSTFYIITHGLASVLAYDMKTGQALWSTKLPWSPRYIATFAVVDNLIYVGTPDDLYFMRADTGEITHTFKKAPTEETLMALEPELRQFTSPESINIDYIKAYTVINKDIMLMPNGYIEHRRTGDVLWDMDDILLPNVLTHKITEDRVYTLTEEGELLAYDVQTGKIIGTLFRLEPSPLPSKDGARYSIFYYIAVDEEEGLLYVYIENSSQVFAVKIVNYPGN